MTEYKDVVLSMSRGLKVDESNDLAYLYELPQCNRSLDVLMQLEVRQIISEGNPESLPKVLERVNRADLASKARKSKWYKSTIKKKKLGSVGATPPPSTDKLMQMELDLIRSHLKVLKEHSKTWSVPSSTAESAVSGDFETIMDCLNKIERKIKTEADFCNFSSNGSSSEEETCTSPRIVATNTKKKLPSGAIPLIGMFPAPIQEDCGTEDDTGDSGFVDAKQFLKKPLHPPTPKTKPNEETVSMDGNEDIDEHVYDTVQPRIKQKVGSRYMKLKRDEIMENEYAQVSTTTTTLCRQETHYQLDKNDADDDETYSVIT